MSSRATWATQQAAFPQGQMKLHLKTPEKNESKSCPSLCISFNERDRDKCVCGGSSILLD